MVNVGRGFEDSIVQYQNNRCELSHRLTRFEEALHKSAEKPIRLLGTSVGLAAKLDGPQSIQLN